LIIPAEKIEECLGNYKSRKNVIFNTYHECLMEVLETMNPVAFKRMNKPLSYYLRNKSKYYIDSEIKIPHQDVTYDSHTSRVVILRLLKQLENINKIKLNRGSIERWITSNFRCYLFV
jgi:CRP/FNR family transcriptional regulator